MQQNASALKYEIGSKEELFWLQIYVLSFFAKQVVFHYFNKNLNMEYYGKVT